MPILKNLTFTCLPARSHDPVANRRAKLVGRLEDRVQAMNAFWDRFGECDALVIGVTRETAAGTATVSDTIRDLPFAIPHRLN